LNWLLPKQTTFVSVVIFDARAPRKFPSENFSRASGAPLQKVIAETPSLARTSRGDHNVEVQK
jgi:hypothetical protein